MAAPSSNGRGAGLGRYNPLRDPSSAGDDEEMGPGAATGAAAATMDAASPPPAGSAHAPSPLSLFTPGGRRQLRPPPGGSGQQQDEEDEAVAGGGGGGGGGGGNGNAGRVPLLSGGRMAAAVAAGVNQAPLWSCVAVLANNMMGAGTLGLPHGLAQTGWLLGGLMLLASCALSAHGLHLLTLSARTAAAGAASSSSSSSRQPTSFKVVCQASIPRWAFLVDLAIAIKCYGVAVSYLIIVGDLMPLAVRDWHGHGPEAAPASPAETRWLWVALSFLLAAPLAFAPRLTALKYTSGLSVGIVLALAFVATLYAAGAWPACGDEAAAAAAAADTDTCRGDYVAAKGGVSFFQTIPVFVFAYTCHQNFPVLLDELRSPTDARVIAAIGGAAGLSLATYLVVSQAAYWTYGSLTSKDVLQSFPASGLVTWLRAGISLLVTLTFPLQAHPARTCILNLWAALSDGTRNGSGSSGGSGNHAPTANDDGDGSGAAGGGKASGSRSLLGPDDENGDGSSGSSSSSSSARGRRRYRVVTACFLGLTLAVALAVSNLSLVLELVGATGSTIVSYLLPGVTYAVLHPWPHWRGTLARAQFYLGLAIIPTCLVAICLKNS